LRIEREKLHPSALEVAARLRSNYADVPLVALGQTVFWDEPVKAALCMVLEALAPGSHTFAIGINDHDYFSKTSAPLPTDAPFAILEHNDGTTHDLWVATGELSMLFGGETVLTRERLHGCGVEVEKVAKGCPEGREACIDRITAAWGWRGIAQTRDHRHIAHEIRLSDVLPWLTEILEWGFRESAALLEGEDARESAERFGEEVVEWLRRFDHEHPGALLSDAYQEAHRLFFRKLAGCDPERVTTFTSTDLFLFNRETVERPRFALLNLFLKPESREIACAAYDAAVEGSNTYTLDRFGEGAIPFDLVVPAGRGTLRILDDAVVVETPEPIRMPVPRRIESARELAEVVEDHFGQNTTLIGKGHVFVCMVTAEAILVFHESGSAYVHRTARLMQTLADRGFSVPLYPILRIRHHTWDALAGCGVRFRLPEHLAAAFGAPVVTATEFATRWQEVVDAEKRLLQEISALSSPRELVSFLGARDDGEWLRRLEEYTRAHDLLLEIRDRSRVYEERSRQIYEEIQRLKSEALEMEREKGENFRRTIKPLRERLFELAQEGVVDGPEVEELQRQIEAHEAPRAHVDAEIRARRERVAALENEAKEVRKARMENEKGPAAVAARQAIAEVEKEAERAKLQLVRRALLVSLGLPACNLRPTAWWFPLVDPSGEWFRNLAHRMELRFERLGPVDPATGGGA